VQLVIATYFWLVWFGIAPAIFIAGVIL